ncbi:MAG: hypothetical protein ACOX5Z_12840 [Desulfobulbus sp.]
MGTDKTTRTPIRGEVTDETIFKAAKEIAVKFIETGKVSPATFEATFIRVYRVLEKTVRSQ